MRITAWLGIRSALIAFALLSAGCSVTARLQDGYDAGDVTLGLVDDLQIYCETPVKQIRAVGRFAVLTFLGVPLPDPCALGGL